MSASGDVSALVAVLARLRDPDGGCPWDRVQDHRSLAPYAIEEAYEVVDAIERGDDDDLRDELGDLLLQVVYHARVAEERGRFSFGDIVDSVTAKMIRRHPHVFAAGADAEVPLDWEAQKTLERQSSGKDTRSVLSGIPAALPAMTRALKLQNKAARVGFDWNDAATVIAKIREEIGEIEAELGEGGGPERVSGEVGDLLFAVVNLARHLSLDPETAVRTTNRKFEARFAFIEQQLQARGVTPADATLVEMDALWDAAKRAGL